MRRVMQTEWWHPAASAFKAWTWCAFPFIPAFVFFWLYTAWFLSGLLEIFHEPDHWIHHSKPSDLLPLSDCLVLTTLLVYVTSWPTPESWCFSVLLSETVTSPCLMPQRLTLPTVQHDSKEQKANLWRKCSYMSPGQMLGLMWEDFFFFNKLQSSVLVSVFTF